MAEFKDRLEQALELNNIKPADLARLTGIGEGAISQYRKGAYKATQRNLEKISKVLNVPLPWLMSATDEKEPPTVFDEGLNEVTSIFEQLSQDNRAKLLELSRLYLNAQNKNAGKE